MKKEFIFLIVFVFAAIGLIIFGTLKKQATTQLSRLQQAGLDGDERASQSDTVKASLKTSSQDKAQTQGVELNDSIFLVFRLAPQGFTPLINSVTSFYNRLESTAAWKKANLTEIIRTSFISGFNRSAPDQNDLNQLAVPNLEGQDAPSLAPEGNVSTTASGSNVKFDQLMAFFNAAEPYIKGTDDLRIVLSSEEFEVQGHKLPLMMVSLRFNSPEIGKQLREVLNMGIEQAKAMPPGMIELVSDGATAAEQAGGVAANSGGDLVSYSLKIALPNMADMNNFEGAAADNQPAGGSAEGVLKSAQDKKSIPEKIAAHLKLDSKSFRLIVGAGDATRFFTAQAARQPLTSKVSWQKLNQLMAQGGVNGYVEATPLKAILSRLIGSVSPLLSDEAGNSGGMILDQFKSAIKELDNFSATGVQLKFDDQGGHFTHCALTSADSAKLKYALDAQSYITSSKRSKWHTTLSQNSVLSIGGVLPDLKALLKEVKEKYAVVDLGSVNQAIQPSGISVDSGKAFNDLIAKGDELVEIFNKIGFKESGLFVEAPTFSLFPEGGFWFAGSQKSGRELLDGFAELLKTLPTLFGSGGALPFQMEFTKSASDNTDIIALTVPGAPVQPVVKVVANGALILASSEQFADAIAKRLTSQGEFNIGAGGANKELEARLAKAGYYFLINLAPALSQAEPFIPMIAAGAVGMGSPAGSNIDGADSNNGGVGEPSAAPQSITAADIKEALNIFKGGFLISAEPSLDSTENKICSSSSIKAFAASPVS
ncbi:MAG TPA: hypothetical protein PKD37_06430 [Oligoflexia bacterium]|nr:hypothetical protein [Oligoflexia bacterium]HMP27597.1 hypothetical protein [Oligoflexia bacterium]